MMVTTTSTDYDIDLKIVLIGDSNVGKSCLLSSFTSKTFKVLPPTIIGADKKLLYLTINGKNLRLSIWDTAGQERFRSIVGQYYKKVHGYIMVYDVTVRNTFTDLSDYWTHEIDKYSTNENSIKLLVGNKADEEMKRVVSRNEGEKLAQENGWLFCECSAKYQINVEKCLHQLVSKILKIAADAGPSQLRPYDPLVSKILKTAADADPSQFRPYDPFVNIDKPSPSKSSDNCC